MIQCSHKSSRYYIRDDDYIEPYPRRAPHYKQIYTQQPLPLRQPPMRPMYQPMPVQPKPRALPGVEPALEGPTRKVVVKDQETLRNVDKVTIRALFLYTM